MQRETKKVREREALDAVYGRRILSEVVEHERPDFLLKLCGDDLAFGVEIVDLYDSEVAARLHRMPEYSGELLGGGTFRHKRDRRELTVDKISITNQADEVIATDIPAIIRKVSSIEACAAKVSEIIRAKDAKLNEPFRLYRHLNLVIVDQTDLLSHLAVSSFYQLYCTHTLRGAVCASRFREVFLITSFKTGRAFVPMKLLITLAQMHLFHNACRSIQGLRFKNVHEFTRLFATYFASLTTSPVAFRHECHESEVLYGDSGFLLSNKLGITVRTYNDHRWPDSSLVAPDTTVLPTSLLEAVSRFERNHTFTSEIAFPVGDWGPPNKAVPAEISTRRKAKPTTRGRAVRG